MGWSVVGTGKMCQLRAIIKTMERCLSGALSGQAMEKAAGAEDEVFPSVREIMNSCLNLVKNLQYRVKALILKEIWALHLYRTFISQGGDFSVRDYVE